MSEWARNTQACTPATMQPDLLASMRGYIAKHAIDLRESEALIAIETTSARKKRGLFGGGRPEMQVRGAIVTPGWLIWATRDAQGEAWSVAARLAEIDVQDYTSPLIPDSGLEIAGFLY